MLQVVQLCLMHYFYASMRAAHTIRKAKLGATRWRRPQSCIELPLVLTPRIRPIRSTQQKIHHRLRGLAKERSHAVSIFLGSYVLFVRSDDNLNCRESPRQGALVFVRVRTKGFQAVGEMYRVDAKCRQRANSFQQFVRTGESRTTWAVDNAHQGKLFIRWIARKRPSALAQVG